MVNPLEKIIEKYRAMPKEKKDSIVKTIAVATTLGFLLFASATFAGCNRYVVKSPTKSAYHETYMTPNYTKGINFFEHKFDANHDSKDNYQK